MGDLIDVSRIMSIIDSLGAGTSSQILDSDLYVANTALVSPDIIAVVSAEEEERLKDIDLFLIENNVTIQKKRLKQLVVLPRLTYEAYKLSVVISNCCRDMNLEKAVETYNAARSIGVVASIDTFSNLISLVAGLGDQGSGTGPPREIEPPTDIAAASAIYVDMKAAGIPFSESIYTAMIRCNSINNRPHEALALYHEMRELNDSDTSTTVMTPKLRTFSPMLAAFSAIGELKICLSLYDDMVNKYNLRPAERDYLCMLKVTIKTQDEVYFYHILNQMKEDIMIPSSDRAWNVFREWFNLSNYTVLESEVTPSGKVLSVPNAKLISIEMDEPTQAQFLSQIECYALNRAYTKNTALITMSDVLADIPESSTKTNSAYVPKDLNSSKKEIHRHEAKWGTFKMWLQCLPKLKGSPCGAAVTPVYFDQPVKISNFPVILPRTDRAYDIVVDGANVGYYKQNFAGAPTHIDYLQLNALIKQLQHRGYKPLLILHNRHAQPSLCGNYSYLIEMWRDEKILLQTPSGWNDDWFWLYTAVVLGCHVVTNDEMRDHHFQMLSLKWFSRWKERHQVHFSFGRWLRKGISDITAEENDAWGLYSHHMDAVDTIDPNCDSLTTVAKAGSVADENVRFFGTGSGVASSSSSSYNNTSGHQPGRGLNAGYSMRLALFDMPSLYSHRVQVLKRIERVVPLDTNEGAPATSGPPLLNVINEYYFPGKNKSTWLCAVKKTQVGDAMNTSTSIMSTSASTSSLAALDKETTAQVSTDPVAVTVSHTDDLGGFGSVASPSVESDDVSVHVSNPTYLTELEPAELEVEVRKVSGGEKSGSQSSDSSESKCGSDVLTAPSLALPTIISTHHSEPEVVRVDDSEESKIDEHTSTEKYPVIKSSLKRSFLSGEENIESNALSHGNVSGNAADSQSDESSGLSSGVSAKKIKTVDLNMGQST